jgi:outer membrane receptor for ferric coprogen and ferric-rhodotorulic acid
MELKSTIKAVLVAAATFASSVAVVMPAAAQSQSAPQARSYQIPAGPLTPTLGQFAAQSGVSVTASSSLTDGKNSPGLTGTHSIQEALSALLRGTGLEAFDQGDGAYVLRVASPAAAATGQTLRKVTVRDTEELGVTEGTGSLTTSGPVTAATGLGLSLRETPQSVTVITRQRMDDQALNSFDKVLEQVPGLYFWSSASGVGSGGEVRARGYPINSLQVDGVTIPSSLWGDYNTAAVDTEIYDSITVVRGATGLLTGAGDPSGSISLTRKRPTDTFQTSVAQSIGRWDQLRSVADVGGPFNARGSLRGRLVAAYDEGESWVDRYQGEKVVVYGVLEADLGDQTTLNLALESAQQNASSAGVWTSASVAFIDGSPTPFSRDTNLRADWSHHDLERMIVATALEHRFTEDWQARLSYSHSDSDTEGRFGWAGVSETNLDGTNDMMLTKYRSKFKVDVFDARLNGRFTLWDRQHEVVIGFNASDLNNSVPLNLFDFVGGVQILDWDGSYPEPDWSTFANGPEKTTTEQSGAYIATHLRPADRLSILAGSRWSNWKTRRRDLTTGAITDDRKESGVFTPYLGVGYDLTHSLTAYVSYTTIFNPQNFKDVNGRTLDPEEGKSWELGLKGEWLEGRLNASAAVFRSGKDDLAVADGNNLTPQGEQAYIATDDTKARGFDAEVSGQLTRGWQIQASYTRTLLEDSSGERLSTEMQPEHQVKLFTTWTPRSVSRLTVGGGVLWQSKIYGTLSVNPTLNDEEPFIDKVYTQNSHAVINLNANYDFNDRLALAVQLNNVLDETYRVHAVNHYYGAPRNLYATLKYRF